MSRKVLVVAFGSFLATLATSDYVLAGQPAWSPNSNLLNTWEPITGELGTLIGDTVVYRTDYPEYQGYTTARFQSDGSSVGVCSRRLWDNFASSSGITVVNTHGLVIGLFAVYSNNESELIDRVNGGGWADSNGDGLQDSNMFVVHQNMVRNRWTVFVVFPWLESNWKPDHDSERSFVIIAACHSADGNVLPSAGGRVGFGCVGHASVLAFFFDINELLRRMNGDIANGQYRRASEAWSSGSYTVIAPTGNLNTTLCPSVETPARVNVYPVGPEGGASGTGYVIFDTHSQIHLEINGDPSKALKYKVIRGDVTIYNIRWNGDHMIEFDYSTDCITDYEVEMTVDAYELRAKGFGFQKLDGGEIDSEGIASNGDDFVWTFESGD